MRFKSLSVLVLAGSVLASLIAAPTASAHRRLQPSTQVTTHLTRATHLRSDGRVGPAAARAMRQGYLPLDQAAYDRAKARANARYGVTGALGPHTPSPSPTIKLAWEGVHQGGTSPSDSTGAIGKTRYIETVNSKVGIYDRTSALVTSRSLGSFWGVGSGPQVFDPQVIWDPSTNRFYYTGDVVNGADNLLAIGWSKVASPNNATTSWCHYLLDYGAEFPDYPKLGDTKQFAMIGVNVFRGNTFRGADVVTVRKPGSGTRCPAGSNVAVRIGKNLHVGTSPVFTPVPANQTDGSSTGYVVARSAGLPSSRIRIFKVTKNANGTANIQTSGASITVPSYDDPPDAPQSGTTFPLDTLDGRMTQAVSAVDPRRNGKVAIWTQHTVAGGAGAMVRWYELDPVNRAVFQTGTVSDSTLFEFNGAISPDRRVSGSTRNFGQNMVLSFNTSSAGTFPDIRMIGKRGGDGVSAPVVVKTSPGPDIDFGCPLNGNVCRWGDYAAATPDPAAPTNATTGRVWLTGMWTLDGNTTGGTSGTSWRSWNWEAKP